MSIKKLIHMNADENDNRTSAERTDRVHPDDLGETKDFNELSYNEEKNSFEFDVKESGSDYDHPLPYDTAAPNGEDDNSTYDEANAYSGTMYNEDKQDNESLEGVAMHIADEEELELSPEDELLARTPEDERDDLDEEGYPVNDVPGKRL